MPSTTGRPGGGDNCRQLRQIRSSRGRVSTDFRSSELLLQRLEQDAIFSKPEIDARPGGRQLRPLLRFPQLVEESFSLGGRTRSHETNLKP